MPSFKLRTDWFKPLIWAVMVWPMARPAASSLAELTRDPVDNCIMALLWARSLTFSEFWAKRAATLVLMLGIWILLKKGFQTVSD
jgi:hypothetical protein